MYNIDEIIELLDRKFSKRNISKMLNISKHYLNKIIYDNNLEDKVYFKKPIFINDYFSKIDCKEKAYILGFLLADCAIDKSIDCKIQIKDNKILEFMSRCFGGIVKYSYTLDKSKRRFPSCRLNIYNNQIVNDIKTIFGGNLKIDRHYPRIKNQYEKYLLQGFFDGDGCITWGYRKDKNRIWQKVSFTSSYKILYGLQQYLIKNNISSTLRPKGKENCFLIEMSSKQDVLKIFNLIYSDNDFIVLDRKYNNYQALRLELGEFGEPINSNSNTEPSIQVYEGVETSGEYSNTLNNHISTQV